MSWRLGGRDRESEDRTGSVADSGADRQTESTLGSLSSTLVVRSFFFFSACSDMFYGGERYLRLVD